MSEWRGPVGTDGQAVRIGPLGSVADLVLVSDFAGHGRRCGAGRGKFAIIVNPEEDFRSGKANGL
jgi:hypothetical protein